MRKIFLMFIVGCFLPSCDVGDFESVLITPHYSIFYASDFAERFSLPKEKMVNLQNNHLKAIAIGIRKSDKGYVCNIHVYYDATIKFYSLNERDMFIKRQQQEYYFTKQQSDSDYKYSDDQLLKNTGRAYFRSKSLKTLKTGTSSTVGYSSYTRIFLPNLNIASFNIGCGFLDARHGAAELWVQKEGLVNYKLIDEDPLKIKNKENNYRFDVPLALLQSVKPMIDRINALPVDSASLNISVQYGAKE